jgi:hypothetical protein
MRLRESPAYTALVPGRYTGVMDWQFQDAPRPARLGLGHADRQALRCLF